MMRIRNPLRLVAILAGVALLGAPSQADAGFKLRYSFNGGTDWTTVDGTDALGDGTVWNASADIGSFTIGASANTFLSGFFSLMDLQVNGIAEAGDWNLVVQASIDGVFTAPPPQILHYVFTGSVVVGSGLTATMRTWVDDDNQFFGTTDIVADTGSKSVPSSGDIIFSAGAPYSWTAEIRLTGTSTAVNSLSLDNNSVIAVPAPAGLVLALASVPVLGIGAWLRRRQSSHSA